MDAADVADPRWFARPLPVCADPAAICLVASPGMLNVCRPTCRPLLQDCIDDHVLLPHLQLVEAVFVSDASGDEGSLFDPCDTRMTATRERSASAARAPARVTRGRTGAVFRPAARPRQIPVQARARCASDGLLRASVRPR